MLTTLVTSSYKSAVEPDDNNSKKKYFVNN